MARDPKPKSQATPKPKFTDKAQSERFIEAAQTHEIEQTGPTFDSAFEKVVRIQQRQTGRANRE